MKSKNRSHLRVCRAKLFYAWRGEICSLITMHTAVEYLRSFTLCVFRRQLTSYTLFHNHNNQALLRLQLEVRCHVTNDTTHPNVTSTLLIKREIFLNRLFKSIHMTHHTSQAIVYTDRSVTYPLAQILSPL